MTGLIKGAFFAIVGLGSMSTLAIMLASNKATSNYDTRELVTLEDQPDIAKVPELSQTQVEQAEVGATSSILLDEFSPIQAIKQRDTLASVTIQEAIEQTGLTREQINTSIVNNIVVEGYLFEFDQENAAISILMPPDTTVYPNMQEATVLTGLPKELITLSIMEQKTVEGTKFGYEK